MTYWKIEPTSDVSVPSEVDDRQTDRQTDASTCGMKEARKERARRKEYQNEASHATRTPSQFEIGGTVSDPTVVSTTVVYVGH
jgi:hypothetical protein